MVRLALSFLVVLMFIMLSACGKEHVIVELEKHRLTINGVVVDDVHQLFDAVTDPESKDLKLLVSTDFETDRLILVMDQAKQLNFQSISIATIFDHDQTHEN